MGIRLTWDPNLTKKDWLGDKKEKGRKKTGTELFRNRGEPWPPKLFENVLFNIWVCFTGSRVVNRKWGRWFDVEGLMGVCGWLTWFTSASEWWLMSLNGYSDEFSMFVIDYMWDYGWIDQPFSRPYVATWTYMWIFINFIPMSIYFTNVYKLLWRTFQHYLVWFLIITHMTCLL